jgi:hypothetical protein
MIDAEVLRLRKLRNVALRARALAKVLDSDAAEGRSIFARSALTCWTIARIASGRLQAHPYLSYQRGPSRLSELADSLVASFVALNARRQNRCLSVYAQQLQIVARELNDVRSLTLTPDLSDVLGRMQTQMSRLAGELDRGTIVETGTTLAHAKAIAGAEANDALEEITAGPGWPYLAIQ